MKKMFTFLTGLAFLVLPITIFSAAPVDLINFEVSPSGQHVVILWTTQSETDCDYFQVQKSRDTQVWFDVGTADGAGNSNEVVNYNYLDSDAWPAQSHYRLIQFDGSGDFYVLATEIVNLINLEEFDIYPNPANDLVTINSDYDLSDVDFILKDLGGNSVDLSKNVKHNKVELNTSELQNGIYILQSSFGKSRISKRIIISHNR